MSNDESLTLTIKMVDEASAKLAAVASKLKELGDVAEKTKVTVGQSISAIGSHIENFGKSMTSVGQSMSIGLSLPIIALGKSVVDTSMQFEASMALIRTQAGATQQEVDSMTKSVLELAKSGETGQGPQKLADGLYHLESLGLRGAQALDALKTSAQAADLGIADMEGVTNALGAAIVTGIKGTENLNSAMGLLDATIGQGNMKMNDLVAALGTGVLPAAKNFGLSLRDVGAALATLTDNGMRADESATRLRMTFSLMAAPSDKAAANLKEIGISSNQLAEDMRSGGIVKAVDDLKEHLESSGKSATEQAAILSRAFGGGRSSAAILTLIEQSDRLKNKFDAIGASADTFQEKVNATHETNLFKYNEALAKIQATLIDLGGTVLPLFARALEKISVIVEGFVKWWDKLSPSVQKFIAVSLAVIAVLGPVLYIVGNIVTVVGLLFSGIGALISAIGFLMPVLQTLGVFIIGLSAPIWLTVAAIAAIGLIAYEVWKHWDVIKPKLIAIWEAISGTFKGAIEEIKSLFNDAMKAIEDGIKRVTDLWNAMKNMVSKSVSVAGSTISGVVSTLVKSVTSHEFGGTVPGLAGEPQMILAHGGETVIPAGRSSTNGGGDINIVINNPTVRSQSDITALRNEIESYMRPLLENAKVVHV